VPVFGVLFVRNEKRFFAAKFQGGRRRRQRLRAFCYWIAVRMVSARLFSLIAVIFVGGLAVVYANLEPRYRLADQVPGSSSRRWRPAGRLDAKLTGANPDRRPDRISQERASLYAPQTLQIIADVHSLVEKPGRVANVWSLETLRRLACGKSRSSTSRLGQGIMSVVIPAHWSAFHFRRSGCGGGVGPGSRSGFKARCLPVVENLDHALDTVRKDHPGYEIAVTGLRRSPRATAPAYRKAQSRADHRVRIVAVSSGWRSARWS